MFPEEFSLTLWDAIWVNVGALATHPVVLGIIVINLALAFAPFIPKAMMALTGRSAILGPRTSADMMAQKRGEGGLWVGHEDSMAFDDGYRKDYSEWRFGRYMKSQEGYYDPDEWHEI